MQPNPQTHKGKMVQDTCIITAIHTDKARS